MAANDVPIPKVTGEVDGARLRPDIKFKKGERKTLKVEQGWDGFIVVSEIPVPGVPWPPHAGVFAPWYHRAHIADAGEPVLDFTATSDHTFVVDFKVGFDTGPGGVQPLGAYYFFYVLKGTATIPADYVAPATMSTGMSTNGTVHPLGGGCPIID